MKLNASLNGVKWNSGRLKKGLPRNFQIHLGWFEPYHHYIYYLLFSVCGKEYMFLRSLKNHKLTHETKDLHCPICHKEYKFHSFFGYIIFNNHNFQSRWSSSAQSSYQKQSHRTFICIQEKKRSGSRKECRWKNYDTVGFRLGL
jgi:hypothetical protein